MFLERMTTAQAEAALKRDPIAVLPLGSTEQHGPQCALGTDFLVPRNLAERVEAMEGMENVVVLPTIPFGVCDYHMSFSGTINIGYEGLYMLLSKVTKAMMQHGVRRFAVINGHGGNTPAIDQAALEVYRAGGILASIDWWSVVGQIDQRFANGGHGDILETSAMMAVDERCVDLSLCRDMNPGQPTEEISAKYIQAIHFRGGTIRLARDTRELAPSGWFGPGDPRGSTRAHGEAMLEVCAEYIRDFLAEFRNLL